MTRTWTEVGKNHTDNKQGKIGAMLDRLEWHSLPYTMGAMPGMGIKEAIKQLKLPKVSHVSCSHELAPYGLLGVKAHYKNGDVKVYLVDEGIGLVVIATDFEAN